MHKAQEIWKDIASYEGLYQISNLGNVRSIKYSNKIRLKKPTANKGYMYVMLYKNNEHKTMALHRLVASEFIENKANKPEVNHIDGNRANNVLSNLEWVTRSENNIHSYKKLNRRAPCLGVFGKDHASSKPILQIEKTDESIIKEWPSHRDAYRELGICYKGISACCRNLQKSAGGFKWKFKTDTL